MHADHVQLLDRITKDDPRRRYLVLSAPGDEVKEKRVTQLLVKLAQVRGNAQQQSNLIDEIVAKYEALYNNYGPCRDTVSYELQQRASMDLEPNAYLANLKAFGEEMQARLFAQATGATFVDPREFLLLDVLDAHYSYDNAKVLPKTYDLICQKVLPQEGILIFPGFYGVTEPGEIATFSFGGSNKTASVLARGLSVDCYENFTDTPIRAAHPKIVPNARIIPEMTYKELRDLSYSGFDIFHKEATAPLMGTTIPLHVRSTEHYPEPGTMVVEDRVSDPDHPIVGIAYKPGFAAFSVERVGLNDEEGVLYRLLQVFHGRHIPIEFPATGIDDITLIVEQSRVRDSVSQLKAALADALGNTDAEVTFQDNLGCLAVAGKGLARSKYISADIERTLADASISVVADSKGVQKRCFMYAVDMQQGHRAVRGLYERFVE